MVDCVTITNMRYDEFKRHMGKSGLVNKTFAELIGVHEKTLSNMAQKEKIPNHAAALVVLMGILAENNIPFRDALEKLKLKKAAPRGKSFNKKEKTED